MIPSNSYYIVPKLPSCGFPCKDNRSGSCGQHSLKTIIEGFHSAENKERKEYSTGRISRTTGNMLPRNLKSVLNKYNVPSEYFYCRWKKNSAKINFLKEKIKAGPIILLISHAYSSRREFSFRRAFTKQHYITLRGYDDEKKVFFVYDSNVEKKSKEGSLPAGNITLSYNKLIRYRRLAARGLHRNFGIAVTY